MFLVKLTRAEISVDHTGGAEGQTMISKLQVKVTLTDYAADCAAAISDPSRIATMVGKDIYTRLAYAHKMIHPVLNTTPNHSCDCNTPRFHLMR
jgi:hypothetical protein